MTSRTFSALKGDLISLGIWFGGVPSGASPDPEKTILEALSLASEDIKVFRLLLQWCLICSELVNVERLGSLTKKGVSPEARILLAGLALKVQLRDKRWEFISSKLSGQIKDGSRAALGTSEYTDAFRLDKYGTDPDFAQLGLRIAHVEPAGERKVLPIGEILKRNKWLWFRALIGANYRADLVYLITQKLVENPFQASNLLGCSYQTVHRLWPLSSQAAPLLHLP